MSTTFRTNEMTIELHPLPCTDLAHVKQLCEDDFKKVKEDSDEL